MAASCLPHFLEAGSWASYLSSLSFLTPQVFIKCPGILDTLYMCVLSVQRHGESRGPQLLSGHESIIRALHLQALSEATLLVLPSITRSHATFSLGVAMRAPRV